MQCEVNERYGMEPREAIRILMLSPIYFRLTLSQRWELIREYCTLMSRLRLNAG